MVEEITKGANAKDPGAKDPGAKPEATIDEMTAEARAHLLQAFRRILRPLVKLLIRAGVRFDEFCETVKGVYVESAVRDGLGPLGKGTRSRIAFVTGIPRRDVDRYIDDPSLLAGPRATDSKTITEILHVWHTDPNYQAPYGVPIALDFQRERGRSFTELVRRANPGSDPVAVLDELLRAGVVTGSVDQLVRVRSRAYVVPEALSAPMLEHMGTTLANLASTIEFNIASDNDEKRLERSVIADRGLPEEVIPRFDAFVRGLVKEMMVEIDDWLGDLAKNEPHVLQGPNRMDTGLTVFHYVRSQKPLPLIRDLIGKD
ncbi:MAG: hypothetical protein NAOJABEB_02762 [Steroidobacteraceae bacterium]|nr:hypothetical protein [Steroidobacteraceae bacterium]